MCGEKREREKKKHMLLVVMSTAGKIKEMKAKNKNEKAILDGNDKKEGLNISVGPSQPHSQGYSTPTLTRRSDIRQASF